MPIALMWDAAFDYARLTYGGPDADEMYQEVYKRTAVRIVAEQDGGQVREQPWSWLGYRGITTGLVQAGVSAQGAILQASQWAAQALRELYPPYTGVPRADIQVTVWYDADPGEMVQTISERSADSSKLAGGRAWRTALVKGYGNGDTAYLGARTSDRFLRVYDKGRERGEGSGYENSLRYEAELKNEEAAAVWAGEAIQAPGRDWVAAQVRRYLRDKGVYLALPDTLRSPEMWRRTTPPTTTDSRLAWLRNQVRPSLDKLVADGVSLEHIREVLGLS